jgi:hypothetical protein
LSHQFSHNIVVMPERDGVDIRAEIARVQEELVLFRQRILPAFFGTPIHEVFQDEYAEWVQEKIATRAGLASNWQRATSRLAELLPLGPLATNSPKINRDDFKEFLFQPAKPSFSVREGRIVWQITLYMDLEMCFCCWRSCSSEPMDGPETLAEFLADLPAVRHWLMNMPVDSTQLANSLCSVLPHIADADPGFAKLALDPETWRSVVAADRTTTDEERTKRLQMIDGQWFGHVLNNALLHVLGALANNNFLVIEDFLDHPYLVGGYSHLMSHYIFAVLVEKVMILRQLAQERHELWALPQETLSPKMEVN